jgi:hypothetical protein
VPPEFSRKVIDAQEERKNKLINLINRLSKNDYYGEVSVTFKAGNIVNVTANTSVDLEKMEIEAV